MCVEINTLFMLNKVPSFSYLRSPQERLESAAKFKVKKHLVSPPPPSLSYCRFVLCPSSFSSRPFKGDKIRGEGGGGGGGEIG